MGFRNREAADLWTVILELAYIAQIHRGGMSYEFLIENRIKNHFKRFMAIQDNEDNVGEHSNDHDGG